MCVCSAQALAFELSGVIGRKKKASINACVAACNGRYVVDPSGAQFGGRAVFVNERGDRFAFISTGKRRWTITNSRADFENGVGCVNAASTGGQSPAAVAAWRVFNDSAKKWETSPDIKTVALSGRSRCGRNLCERRCNGLSSSFLVEESERG